MARHKYLDDKAMGYAFAKAQIRELGPTYSAFKAGWEAALAAASEVAYSVNNHDEHMNWVIPTGPNSDRCGWCACLETIANKLNPDLDFGKDGYVPGIHDNEAAKGGEE